MTIVVVAFCDDAKHSVSYRTFDGSDCVALASQFYQSLLDEAMFATVKRKPRVISTRIILDT